MRGSDGGGCGQKENDSDGRDSNLRGTARSRAAGTSLAHTPPPDRCRGEDHLDPLRTGAAKLGKARRLSHQGCIRVLHWPWGARMRGHEARRAWGRALAPRPSIDERMYYYSRRVGRACTQIACSNVDVRTQAP